MRGEAEQKCLDIIKNSKEIEIPQKYFGFQQTDVNEIVDSIRKAEPNKNLSNFPDFTFDKGFIEHFKVTSSKTNKKGSTHLKKENNFKRKVELEAMKLKEKWSNDFSDGEVHSQQWAMEYPEHSYHYFYESFTSNWKNHIESMKKYNGNKDISIFMIEYTDLALTMYEDVFEDWIDGMSNGDLREPENVEFYRISRDKGLLNYIYEFKDVMKYVVFVYGKEYEAIKIDNIPYILKLMPWNYIIAPYMNPILISSLYEIGRIKPYVKGEIDSEQNR